MEDNCKNESGKTVHQGQQHRRLGPPPAKPHSKASHPIAARVTNLIQSLRQTLKTIVITYLSIHYPTLPDLPWPHPISAHKKRPQQTPRSRAKPNQHPTHAPTLLYPRSKQGNKTHALLSPPASAKSAAQRPFIHHSRRTTAQKKEKEPRNGPSINPPPPPSHSNGLRIPLPAPVGPLLPGNPTTTTILSHGGKKEKRKSS